MPEPYRPKPPPEGVRLAKPKRVRGGVKLAGEMPSQAAWTSQRVMRLLETVGKGEALVEGLLYARMGQTKRWTFEPGRITGFVQGRSLRAYTTTIELATLTDEQWQRVLPVLALQAGYAARILARELPASVEEAFAGVGLRLCPSEPGDLTPSCTCQKPDPGEVWCKHACCLLALLADHLESDPFLLFRLRGMAVDDLLEQLHRRRAANAPGGVAAGVYSPSVTGLSDSQAPPLDQSIEAFWEAGPGLSEIDLPIDPPRVSHPLLRRLGPSPVEGAMFPFVGLMATCYELITQATIRRELGEEPASADDAPPDEGRPGQQSADEPGDEPGA